MSHIGHTKRAPDISNTKTAGKSGLDEDQIDAANTIELQQAPLAQLLAKGQNSGEAVGMEDLWNCLFKQKPQPKSQLPMEAEPEIARHLRAAVVEERLEQSNEVEMGEDASDRDAR